MFVRLLLIAATLLIANRWSTAQEQPAPWTHYLKERTEFLSMDSQRQLERVSAAQWPQTQKLWRSQLQEMLGLMPWPERNELASKVTGTIQRDDYRVSNVVFQSRPGLYVTANLYEPTTTKAPATGWPAVLYVCGHANVRDQARLLGNKTSYQHHGIWFARHNVVCLIIDTVQLGELHGEHHGTYKLGKWDWISRGYTPAGVEAWNAMRAIDYLETIPNVDKTRIGITGRSGGGAYSWFAAALDERIDVAVPVAGITDLQNHVIDGCVEGHCDCMYFVNYYGWDYNRLAALIAPRALLLANSDNDSIFPIDGVERIHRDVAGHYRRLGASNKFGLLLTPGPHLDTQELQVGAFRWLLTHLTGQTPTVDRAAVKELEPAELQVFTQETPADQRVAALGSWFVPEAKLEQPPEELAKAWKERLWEEIQSRWPVTSLPAPSQDYKLEKSGSQRGVDWRWFRQARAGDAANEQEWRSQVVVWNGAANERPPVVHMGPLWDAVVSAGLLERELGNEGTLRRLFDAQPDRAHILLLPRSQQIAAAKLSVRTRTQLERRFYLLGESTELLALQDMRAQLQWLSRESLNTGSSLSGAGGSMPAAFKSPLREIELVGYARQSPLAVLAALSLGAGAPNAAPKLSRLTLQDYPKQWNLAPVLPGIARTIALADLITVARENMTVNLIDSHSPNEVTEGYDNTHQLLVDSSSGPQQASGIRIVEPAQDSVKIWCRATRWPLPNLGDMPTVQFVEDPKFKAKERGLPVLPSDGTAGLAYAAPGVTAELSVRYRTAGKGYWRETPWMKVGSDTDYSQLFELKDLEPDTKYEVTCRARTAGSTQVASTTSGEFRTLPLPNTARNLRLAIGTCQEFEDRDGEYGMDLYRTLLHRHVDMFVLAGDVVYYDKLARSVPLAYYHWQRTYSLPTLVNFHRTVPTYFLKDDHDTYVNDSWPGQYHPWTRDFTFEDGQRIFQQQTGVPAVAYRTERMGRDLQVWFMEGRDFRAPNSQADGPGKSIWGDQQWKWLEKTLAQSDAKFKVIVSPTPIVGPDRDNKGDNHANKAFATEGKRVREVLAKIPNLVVVCGDRHWQYHSRDPETGLHEFSVGPVTNRHAGGWDAKDFRKGIHQFLRVGGGYLELKLKSEGSPPELSLTHFDPYGAEQHSHTLR